MEINIQFVKIPTSEHMEAFVLKELKKLEKKLKKHQKNMRPREKISMKM